MIGNISSDISFTDISKVMHLLSYEIHKHWSAIVNRPAGSNKVLIRTNQLDFHNWDLELRGNILVCSSIFSGYSLTGLHPDIEASSIKWYEDVAAIRFSVETSHIVNVPDYDYFDHENLQFQPPKRYEKWLEWRDCSFCHTIVHSKSSTSSKLLSPK